MKRALWIADSIALIATIAFFALAIWTSDTRWLYTALLGVATSFGLTVAATYPGWDE